MLSWGNSILLEEGQMVAQGTLSQCRIQDDTRGHVFVRPNQGLLLSLGAGGAFCSHFLPKQVRGQELHGVVDEYTEMRQS